jgi:hypothetical protein
MGYYIIILYLIILHNSSFVALSSNILSKIVGFTKKVPEIFINRAYITYEIIEKKYPHFSVETEVINNKRLRFTIKNKKKTVILDIVHPSFMEIKKNKGIIEKEVLNRKYVLEILEWLGE